ncbi:MAG: protein kinase [Candidatus Sumerlaeota bacterium]|nr:protein kinase [Candidatus Sumerlaeota bacterium]
MRLPFFPSDRLGDRLVRAGVITREQLRQALARQKIEGHRLGYNLISLNYLTEENLVSFLSEQYRVPSIILDAGAISAEVDSLLDMDFMVQREVVPIMRAGRTLTLGMVDPSDEETIREVERRSNLQVHPVIACQSAMRRALARQRIKAEIPLSLAFASDAEREELGDLFAVLDDYKLIGRLGEGGFGQVYKCLQRSLDRFVAVKTLNKNKMPVAEVIERFRREGKIAARLNHVSIVRMIEQGEAGKMLYMVMEYVDGRPMDEYLDDKPFEEKLDIMIQVADALAYAHSQGVLHRDIKPSNILVDSSGLSHLLDFGIALLRDTSVAPAGAGIREARLTQANVVMGTPQYMAPEHRGNMRDVDERADIYSLGVIMYEVFTKTLGVASPPRDPREIVPDLPESLAATILQCLADHPGDRPSSAAALRDSLLELRDRLAGAMSGDSLDACLRHVIAPNREIALKDHYAFVSNLRDDDRRRVILAEHKTLKRLVVIKRYENKEGLATAKILARVKHPHIGDILGLGEDSQSYITISEYLNGGSLADRLNPGQPAPGDQMIPRLLAIARALEFMRQFQIPHGHLHPENILFSGDGVMKVVDFSTSALCNPAMERFFKCEGLMAKANIAEAYARDEFSLGILLYEMISGRRFLLSKSAAEQYDRLHDIPIHPSRLKDALKKLWTSAPPEKQRTKISETIKDLEGVLDAL